MSSPEVDLDVVRRVVLAADEERFSRREWFIYAKALAVGVSDPLESFEGLSPLEWFARRLPLALGVTTPSEPRDPFAADREVFKRVMQQSPEIRTVDDAAAAVSPYAEIRASFGVLLDRVRSLENQVALALLGDMQIRGAVEESRLAAYSAIGKHPPGSFAWARAQHELGLSTESPSTGGDMVKEVPWERHHFNARSLVATDWRIIEEGSEP